MNKYSKKKNIWNTTYDLQPGPICVVLGAAVLAVFTQLVLLYIIYLSFPY